MKYSSLYCFLLIFNLVYLNALGSSIYDVNPDVVEKLRLKYDVVNTHDFHETGVYIIAKKSKWGIADSLGYEIIKPIYDKVYPEKQTYPYNGKIYLVYKVWTGKLCGLCNLNGEVIISPKYTGISIYGKDCIVKKGDKEGVCDFAGNEIISPTEYSHIEHHDGEPFFRVRKKDKHGLLDLNGEVVIACSFAYIDVLRNGTFIVKKSFKQNDQQATIDIYSLRGGDKLRQRIVNASCTYLKRNSFQQMVMPIIEYEINQWQRKREFESLAEYKKRVTEKTRLDKAQELFKSCMNNYINYYKDVLYDYLFLEKYDSENQTFLVNSLAFGPLLIPVPSEKALEFKKTWGAINHIPSYTVNSDGWILSKLTLELPNREKYIYNSENNLNYSIANIDYNFNPIEQDLVFNTTQSNQTISHVDIAIGKSDVDVNIPVSNIVNDNTFAVIISNEDYQKEAKVNFAKNDGQIFYEYCQKTLGIPQKNIHYIVNATLNNIRAEIEWIGKVAEAYAGNINIIVYYAGHGIPNEQTRDAYLLPVDGYGSDVTTGYKLSDLYNRLGHMPAKQIVVFLDACFSGAQRSGEMLYSARGVAIKPNLNVLDGNVVVFSAATGSETAYPYKEKSHGLFTYFLLKKLQDTHGNISLGELVDFISKKVAQQSIIVNLKSQSPTIISSASMANKWKMLKLK